MSKLERAAISVQTYAHYYMTAETNSKRYGRMKLSAISVTPEHKEQVLSLWSKMKAINISIEEITDTPDLPEWHIEYTTNGKYAHHKAVVRAGSAAHAKELVKENKKKQYFTTGKYCLITKCVPLTHVPQQMSIF